MARALSRPVAGSADAVGHAAAARCAVVADQRCAAVATGPGLSARRQRRHSRRSALPGVTQRLRWP